MKRNFGDKIMREAMLKDPLLREQWEDVKPVHSLSPVDHLIAKVGIAMVQAVETYYNRYRQQPNEKNAKTYITWRFRLHRHLKNDRETLEAINSARNLGLFDESPGKTFWDCEF